MPSSTQQNKLLRGMSQDDYHLLESHLNLVETRRGFTAMRPHQAFKDIYFPVSGMTSFVGRSGGHDIEIGVAGSEGMIGVSILIGIDTTPYEAYTQIAGQAFQVSTVALRSALAASGTLHAYLNRYAYAHHIQLAETAISHGLQKVENRLARWLLMCDDRDAGKDISIPQESLALMLGVRRAGVSLAIDGFRRGGQISTQRGTIRILDRNALTRMAGSSYGVAESEYKRVMGFSSVN